MFREIFAEAGGNIPWNLLSLEKDILLPGDVGMTLIGAKGNPQYKLVLELV